jgi:hypothetical protein
MGRISRDPRFRQRDRPRAVTTTAALCVVAVTVALYLLTFLLARGFLL